MSKITKNLRDALAVPDAAPGLSIFRLDSFELLVEESTEEHALGALNSLKIKTTDQREPLDFYVTHRYQNYGRVSTKRVRGRMSLPSNKRVVSGPDLQTA